METSARSGCIITLLTPDGGLVTPIRWSARARVTFLRETCMNWAFEELSFTLLATISAFTESRNMSTSSST